MKLGSSQRKLTVYLFLGILVLLKVGLGLPVQAEPVLINPTTKRADSEHENILYSLLLAELAASRNIPTIALQNYIKVAILTQDPLIAEQSTQLAVSLEAPNEALQSAILWAKTAPKNPQAQLIAMVLLIGDSIDKAMPYLSRAMDLVPLEMDQHIAAIQARLSPNSAKNLKKALNRLANDRPKDPYVHLTAAQSAAEQGDIQNANRWVNSALSISPNLTRAIELKARLIRYSSTSDETALNFLTERIKRFPKNSELRLFYASALIDNEQLDTAKKELTKIIEDKTFGGQALVFLGEIHLKENNLNKASEVLEKAVQFKATKDLAKYLLGQKEERRNHLDTAIEWYSDVGPGTYHVPAVLRAVELYKINKDYQNAIYLLHNSSPSTVAEQKQLLLSEVELLNLSKETEDALQLINELLEKLPEDEEILLAHATTAVKLEKWAMAEKDLKKILMKNPNNTTALNTLGYILSLQNSRLKEALVYLNQALALAPNNPMIMDNMGWTYYKLGNLEEALQHLEKAHTISDEGNIAAHFGEILWENNRKSEAMVVWKKGLEKNQENEILLETLKRLKVNLNPR